MVKILWLVINGENIMVEVLRSISPPFTSKISISNRMRKSEKILMTVKKEKIMLST